MLLFPAACCGLQMFEFWNKTSALILTSRSLADCLFITHGLSFCLEEQRKEQQNYDCKHSLAYFHNFVIVGYFIDPLH